MGIINWNNNYLRRVRNYMKGILYNYIIFIIKIIFHASKLTLINLNITLEKN